jgi:hypothetical protein
LLSIVIVVKSGMEIEEHGRLEGFVLGVAEVMVGNGDLHRLRDPSPLRITQQRLSRGVMELH